MIQTRVVVRRSVAVLVARKNWIAQAPKRYGLLRTIIRTQAAAEAISGGLAPAFDTLAGREGAYLNAFSAGLTAFPIGLRHKVTVDQGIIFLREFAIDDVGHTAAGAAVADDIFII